jgi:hypothetical protein
MRSGNENTWTRLNASKTVTKLIKKRLDNRFVALEKYPLPNPL